MPALFVAHGSPMVAIEDSPYGRFLDALGRMLPRPSAIVLFSAHWESDRQRVSSVDTYDTIHDFGGFPDALYRITYPAPGDKSLAERIRERLRDASVTAELDEHRGLDHGAWTILYRMYPAADIPVVAMSVNAGLSPAEQVRIGKVLAPLRAEGVLVIGSGVTVHNFQLLSHRKNPEVREAVIAFEDWLESRLHQWDIASLLNYQRLAPHAHLAVPPYASEHFAPLMYAVGAAGEHPEVKTLYRGLEWDVLTDSVYQFTGGV
ncbi:MAG: dioxygenase [Alicyclobacillus sp.]|nr:dioxygenase [Alicyclobacillus sp.]